MNSQSNDPYGGVKPIVRLANLAICMAFSTWLAFWIFVPYRIEWDELSKRMEGEAYEPTGFLYWVMSVGGCYVIGYIAFLLANKLTTGKAD